MINLEDIEMKKLTLSIAIAAFSAGAYAGSHKTSILHCGAEYPDPFMYYKEISVSKKAKGHANHLNGTTDSVPTGEVDVDGNPVYVDYSRGGDDCIVGLDLIDGLDLGLCTTEAAGDICGILTPGD
jgi:hypothetical protein